MTRRRLTLAVSVVALMFVAQPAGAQTVDALIAKNLEAKGGLDRIKAVTSIRQTGEITVQGMAGGLVVYAMRPNLTRQELTLGTETIVNGFDGETPWMVNTMSGSDQAIVLTGPQAEMIRRQASFDGPLVDYKARGGTAELVGTEEFDGRQVHHIKLMAPGNVVQHVYLDAETGLETRIATEGAAGIVEQRLSDFREVEGLMMPFVVQVVTGGAVAGSMKVTKVELNPDIDVALFRIPTSGR